jgi:predicted aspartyl protease
MLGAVTADGGEPRLPMVVLVTTAGGGYGRVEIEAVVDTGFDSELRLPPEIVRRLGPPYEGGTRGVLADGSAGLSDYHTKTRSSRLKEETSVEKEKPSVLPQTYS